MAQHVSSPKEIFKVMKEKAYDDTFVQQVRHFIEQELHYRPSLMKSHNTDGETVQMFTFFMTGKPTSQVNPPLL